MASDSDSTDSRTAITLEQLIAFHAELLRLERAGIEFDLDTGTTNISLTDQLGSIGSHVAMMLGHGKSIDEVLASDKRLPALYRLAVETWRLTNHGPEAFEILTRPAERRRDRQSLVTGYVLQPFILLCLLVLGLNILLTSIVPSLTWLTSTAHREAGPYLKLARTLYDLLPLITVGMLTFLTTGFFVWCLRARRWNFGWLPGQRGVQRAMRSSAFAEAYARSLETGAEIQSPSETLNWTTVAKDLELSNTSRALSGARPMDPAMDRDSSSSQTTSDLQAEANDDGTSAIANRTHLPPVLRWAFLSPMQQADKVQLLRVVAHAYETKADVIVSKWRGTLPIFLTAAVGGIFVMFYAVLLFGPVVELLMTISAPK